MLRSQEIQLEINTLNDERNAAQRAYMGAGPDKREAAEGEYRQVVDRVDREVEAKRAAQREALDAEHREMEEMRAEVGRIRAGDHPAVPAEMRAFLDLERRARLGGFLQQDFEDLPLIGAEAEMRAAAIEEIGGAHPLMPNPIPWSMFVKPERLRTIRDDQIKLRAVLGGSPTGGTMQDPIIQDVFAASTAAFLGTSFGAAGTGQVIEYVLTSSGATLTARSGAHTAAGSLAATTLQPRRVATKYELQVEQIATIQGLEAAVRMDSPRTIAAEVDEQVLNRGGANRFSNGILRAYTLPTTETNTTNTFARALPKVFAGIDGKFARSPAELKTVVGPETMAVWAAAIASNTAVSIYDYLRMNTAGIMATDHIDVHDTANQYGIVCRTGPGMVDNIAAKMWGGAYRSSVTTPVRRSPRKARSTSTPTSWRTSRCCGPTGSCCSTSRPRNGFGAARAPSRAAPTRPMKGTPTFELRPGDRLHIVRVGVEYPPDATPDAPLPGPHAPAVLEVVSGQRGIVRTAATTRGFEVDWPLPEPDEQTWLVYQDGAGRTQRALVTRAGLGIPEVYDPCDIVWATTEVVRGDVKVWPV